jgi:hypothetical protein
MTFFVQVSILKGRLNASKKAIGARRKVQAKPEARIQYSMRLANQNSVLWSELDSVERELLREHYGRGGECANSKPKLEGGTDADETTRNAEMKAKQRERLLYFRRNNGLKEG